MKVKVRKLSSLISRFSGLSWAKGVELISFQQIGDDAFNKDIIEGNKLFAVHKPPKILSHPNSVKDQIHSLLKYNYDMKNECYMIPRDVWSTSIGSGGEISEENVSRLYLLNRLDQATSGLVLFATCQTIVKLVKKYFQSRRVEKEYIAKVFGRYTNGNWIEWKNFVKVSSTCVINAKRLEAASSKEVNSKLAETYVKCYGPSTQSKNSPTCSILVLKPVTGITHQLRFQCAVRGHTIVGDDVYGDLRGLNRVYFESKSIVSLHRQMHLHAHRIQLQFEGASVPIFAESPVPEYFFQ